MTSTDRSTEVERRLTALARRWGVGIEARFETESSVLAHGRRAKKPVVLKVVKRRGGGEWKSGEVVAAFGGRGMVRALEYVDGAALFEQIVPGTALVELTKCGRDDSATEILADVIAAMSPTAAPQWCPTVTDWGRGFAWYLSTGDTQIPQSLVRRASAIYFELCKTQGETRLLHGDLQHYNILEDRERGWIAIDPKGVVGEVEYEVAAALRNPVERVDVVAEPATIERRIRVLSSRLGLDASRVLRWAFAQAVLSAIWLVEDADILPPENASLTFARAVERLVGAFRLPIS